jgi:RNA 2',3'-cyclic 3'-phosphodiesterase
MTRLFYGIELPPELKREIGQVQRELQRVGVEARNWSHPDLFHLTVLFLGEIPFEKLARLDEVGIQAARQVVSFELTLGELGAFPKNKILWLGLESDAGMRTLEALHRHVRDGVAAHALAPVENRPYRAHLTLARQVQPSSFTFVEQNRRLPVDRVNGRSFPVENLCLFESTRENGKLVYPVRRRYPMGT